MSDAGSLSENDSCRLVGLDAWMLGLHLTELSRKDLEVWYGWRRCVTGGLALRF